MSKIRLLIFLLSFVCGPALRADLVGSTIAVSVEDFKAFPENPIVDNEIRGFAWMQNGFSLANSNTQCIFNALFPVSGTVNVNGGTLVLWQNLRFCDVTDLQGLGDIIGNDHVIYLCPSITQLPADTRCIEHCFIFLDSDLSLLSTMTIRGDCIFSGQGNVLSFADNASFFIDSGASLELRNLEVRGIKDGTISCADDSGTLILDSVQWVQTNTFGWNKGAILFENNVQVSGDTKFTLSSNMTSTVASATRLTFQDGMTFILGRSAINQDPIYFTDSSSVCRLQDANLIATQYGLSLKTGVVEMVGKVQFDAIGTTTSTGVIMGTGVPAEDVTIKIAPGASVVHNTGYWVYNNVSPYRLVSSSQTSRLIRQIGSKIYAPHAFVVNDLTVQLMSNLVTPLQVGPGVAVGYTNAGVILPNIQLDMTANQLNYYTYLLANGGSVFLTKGTLPMYLMIAGTGNQLYGNGGLTGAIIFSNSAASLTCGLNGFINNQIILANGLFTIATDLWIFEQGLLVGPGTIDLQKSQLIYKDSFDANTPLHFKGNTGTIVLNENISLMSTWTISGSCKIEGNGSAINLETNGHIFIDTDAELQLKNIRIIGVHDTNISGAGRTSTLVLENCQWILDGDYTFSTGSMQFNSDNYISGDHTWFYESDQTSTISSDSRLILWNGLNFNIGRTNDNEPLAFESTTALLNFDDSSLYVRNTGMRVTKGTIVTSRNVVVDVDSTSTANGIIFGDGTPENDMTLELSAATSARFVRGHLTYDITNNNGIISKSQTAQMIRSAGSVFYLKHDLQLTDITIDVSPYSHLVVDPGVALTYSKGLIKNGQDAFEITAQWYNFYTMLMAGGGVINLINGKMPLYLLVMGTGNSIDGVGNLGGVIVLANSATNLICNFNGLMANTVILNGGSLTITHDLALANNVTFNGPGTINLGTNSISLGKADITWTDDIWWNSSNGNINLNANVSLATTWTIDGTCTIRGNGHTLRLSGGALMIAPDSKLICQNIKLENIKDNNIVCIDDSGSLLLQDVEWGQRASSQSKVDQNYSFTQGSMQYKGNVTILGSGIFAYESSNTSTILSESDLTFDTGMTFSYYPANASAQLLEFASASSELTLKSAKISIAESGLQLAKGKLTIKGDTQIFTTHYDELDDDGNVTHVGGGLVLGDNSADYDCKCTIATGSNFVLKEGVFSYSNVSAESLVMENNQARFVFYPLVHFNLNQSMNLGGGRLIMDEKILLKKAVGKSITGAVFVEAVS